MEDTRILIMDGNTSKESLHEIKKRITGTINN